MTNYWKVEEEIIAIQMISSHYARDQQIESNLDDLVRRLVSDLQSLKRIWCISPSSDELKRATITRLQAIGNSILQNSNLSSISKNYLQRNLLEKTGDI